MVELRVTSQSLDRESFIEKVEKTANKSSEMRRDNLIIVGPKSTNSHILEIQNVK